MEFDPDGNLIVANGYEIYKVGTSVSFGTATFLAIYDSSMDVESFTFSPEPMTVCLLGLGGLLLRRKCKA